MNIYHLSLMNKFLFPFFVFPSSIIQAQDSLVIYFGFDPDEILGIKYKKVKQNKN